MPRYFFNVRRGQELIVDHDGTELVDEDAALEKALQCAREIVAGKVLANEVIDGEQFEVFNLAGERVLIVPFRSSLRLE
jgi:hypothetical protein